MSEVSDNPTVGFGDLMDDIAQKCDQDMANSIADDFFERLDKMNDGLQYSTVLVAVAFIIGRIVHSSPEPTNPLYVLSIIGSLVMNSETREISIN